MREHVVGMTGDADSVNVPHVPTGIGLPDPTVQHAAPPAWTHGFADDARAVWATLLEDIGRALERHRRRG